MLVLVLCWAKLGVHTCTCHMRSPGIYTAIRAYDDAGGRDGAALYSQTRTGIRQRTYTRICLLPVWRSSSVKCVRISRTVQVQHANLSSHALHALATLCSSSTYTRLLALVPHVTRIRLVRPFLRRSSWTDAGLGAWPCDERDVHEVRSESIAHSLAPRERGTRPPATTHHPPVTRRSRSVSAGREEGATATADSIPKPKAIIDCLREVGDRGT